MQKAVGATERVRELLEEETEPLTVLSPSSSLLLKGHIRFDRVSFRYPSRPDLPVLRELSLEARAGEKIALVGPSGAGKSTIVSLLLRFYEPDSGKVMLDDRDAQMLDLRDVRGNMAMVPQEV